MIKLYEIRFYRRGDTLSTLEQIRQYIQQERLDGFFITSPYNRHYTTNFTGSAGSVLITDTDALFITDFRYIEQAEREAKQFTIVQHKALMIDEVKTQIDRLGLKRVGFEAEHMSMAEYTTYKETLNCELVPTKQVIETFRQIKTEEEIEKIRKAATIADKAFEHILTLIKPGVREIELANELEYFMRKQGATESSFDTIVASGVRSSLPHGVASTKKINEGELITFDFGALYEGYCSDITRTVALGEISDELREIYDIVLEAQKRGVDNIKANISGKEADAFTRDYITEKGYGNYFGHSTGHGIGLEVHEGPSLSPRSEQILKENMVVTVEPGIYIPNVGGCRIEDDIVITTDGNKRLTTSMKEFIQL